MIFAILVGTVTPAQAALPSPASDDIVVIGERLKQLRIVTRKDRRTGRTRCIIKPSSSDPVLDAGICDAYLTCVPKVETAPALEACMKPPIIELVKNWAERKAKGVGPIR